MNKFEINVPIELILTVFIVVIAGVMVLHFVIYSAVKKAIKHAWRERRAETIAAVIEVDKFLEVKK